MPVEETTTTTRRCVCSLAPTLRDKEAVSDTLGAIEETRFMYT